MEGKIPKFDLLMVQERLRPQDEVDCSTQGEGPS